MFHIVICDDDKTITDRIKESLDKKYKNKMDCKCLYVL